MLCCSLVSFPTTYLGLPLGEKYKSTGIWSGLVETIEKRLVTWKRQYLSMGGRLALINSFMDSIPTYFMPLFPVPGRYGMEDNSLWKEVVAAKHGKLSHWCTKQSRTPYGVGPWKHVSRLWEEFHKEVSFNVGNCLTNREGNQWSPLLRRNVNDWELESLFDLMCHLEGFNMKSQAADALSCRPNTKEYTMLRMEFRLLAIESNLEDKTPNKVICFSWLALKSASDTRQPRQEMFPESTESVNHLFLHCVIAADMWHMFQALFSLKWVMPENIKDAVESWSLWKADSPIRNTWTLIPSCIFWCLWTERNNKMFWSVNSKPLAKVVFQDFVSSLTLD
ncbi:hypothetical protein H5410_015713 [Solanum commersonii]|uniref:Uncharacterized protein n=1 Tax=Solanum commersonii TaxID=4109 RepID=A0A9J5ZUH9_SOLCO|nr:hypothetical protein H5410_015713 [Solanum commersonii]